MIIKGENMKIILFKNTNVPQECEVTDFSEITKLLEIDYIEMMPVCIGKRHYCLIMDEEGKLKSNYVSGLLARSYGNTFLVGHLALTRGEESLEHDDYSYIKRHLDYRGGLPVFYAQIK